MTKEITRVEYEQECKRCGRKFISRAVAPLRCAKCGSPYWDKPRKQKHVAHAQ